MPGGQKEAYELVAPIGENRCGCRRRALRDLHRRRRCRPLCEDGAQRHRIRRTCS
ncbi:hypothetical protein M8494_17260 [Serratia ureilytica]